MNKYFGSEGKPTVVCEVEFLDRTNTDGRIIPSVEVTCPECEEIQGSFGQGDRSIKRCLALLKEQCDCDNFLIVD